MLGRGGEGGEGRGGEGRGGEGRGAEGRGGEGRGGEGSGGEGKGGEGGGGRGGGCNLYLLLYEAITIIYISKTYVAMDCLRVSLEHVIFLLAMATFWERLGCRMLSLMARRIEGSDNTGPWSLLSL